MTEDLNGMAVFVAVAEAKGFTAGGERLGVSASAVSQALRRLEERLGVTLSEMADEPRGAVRLLVSREPTPCWAGPFLAGFLAEHPYVDLDIAVRTHRWTSSRRATTRASSSAR